MGKNRKSALMAQVSSTITQMTKQKGLLFKNAFESKGLWQRINKYYQNFRNRAFYPSTTLFAFLSQMLSADRSCVEIVARVNLDRVAQGLDPVSPDNGAYVKARGACLNSLYTNS